MSNLKVREEQQKELDCLAVENVNIIQKRLEEAIAKNRFLNQEIKELIRELNSRKSMVEEAYEGLRGAKKRRGCFSGYKRWLLFNISFVKTWHDYEYKDKFEVK